MVTPNASIDENNSNKSKPALDLGILEEDDDFEEFPADDCATGACEDSGEVSLWEDNWDDDIVEEEFSSLLRAEFQKQDSFAKMEIDCTPSPMDSSIQADDCPPTNLEMKSVETSSISYPQHVDALQPTLDVKAASIKRIHRQRIIGWDGTVWQESSHSEISTDSDYSRNASSSEDELILPRRNRVSVKERTINILSDDDYEDEEDEDDNESGRQALDHKQKMAKAIASKYRLGGRMPSNKPVAIPSTKKIITKNRGKAETGLFFTGALVWALLSKKYQLPWWAGIIVTRPVKRRCKDGSEVCLYRVVLLCPPHCLQTETCVLMPSKYLRPFQSRAAFEAFMRSVLGAAKNKSLALKQFSIPPAYERFWHAARDQMEAASNRPGKSIQARFQYLGINITSLMARCKIDDDRRKHQLAKMKDHIKDNAADSNSNQIVPLKKAPPKVAVKLTIPLRYQSRILPKHDVFAFEALISQGHTPPNRARFICCICFKPGQLQVKKKKGEGIDDSTAAEGSGKTSRVASALLGRLKTVKPIVRPQKSSKNEINHPFLVPCSGRCANYIHLECAVMSSVDKEEAKTQPTCALCRAGLRQCSICMELQPIGSNHNDHQHNANDEVVSMQRCSVSHCRRWFHTTTCMRQLPFAALVREGRADAFTCPAHSCMACFADAPGTRPRPSHFFLHCLLCAATYHPGEWCLPAGSIFLSASWIVCPRHALQGIPMTLFQFTRRASVKAPIAATEPLSIDVAPLSPPTTTPPPQPPHEEKTEDAKQEVPIDFSELQTEVAHSAILSHVQINKVDGDAGPPKAEKEEDEKLKADPEKPRPTAEELIPQMPLTKIVLSDSKRLHLNSMFRPANVSWCFICSKGGRIICCENCPASFHQECLNAKDVPEQFLCEDCMNGRSPRYGEIVWARLPPPHQQPQVLSRLSGVLPVLEHAFPPVDCLKVLAGMRWWPAEILHSRSLRPSTNTATTDLSRPPPADRHFERLGFFPVRLFGLYTAEGSFNGVEELSKPLSKSEVDGKKVFPVCLWTTRSRVFPYEEGDDDRDDDDSGHSSNDSNDECDSSPSGTSGGDSSDASMADEDPIVLSLSASSPPPPLHPLSSSSATTEPHTHSSLASPTVTSHLLMMTSPPGCRDRHNSGVSDLTSPGRMRRRPPTAKATKSTATSKKKSKRSSDTNEERQERKAIYRRAVEYAAEGWKMRKETFAKQMGRTRRPDYYRPIKNNYPIGSVRVYRYTDLSEASQCDCKDSDPCGLNSGCINRALLYECLPSVCPHREACRNQCFTRRDYPLQRPFWTGDERGWGLKTLVPIRKGDFVNEYIGDLIDEEEANRRLRFCHENNITNYYMMQMDSQRIIDAGPKGNLSRFMNHSCCPNLNTQKWTVNGDTRVGLFAVRDIAAGEELTFNYNFCAHGQEMLNCRCGAECCVGYLGARQDHANTATTTSGCATASSPSTEGNANGRNTPVQPLNEEATLTAAASKRGGNSTRSTNIAIVEETSQNDILEADRHETICYRCGHEDVVNACSNRSGSSSSSSSVVTSGHCRNHGSTQKHTSDNDDDEDDRKSTISSTWSTSTVAAIKQPLLQCAKEDCCKAYHLECLDLEKRPKGRWLCPWHHCDACGRPATVFCMRCTASFCPGHVEGSVVILPPTADGEPAQVVCQSHVDLVSATEERLRKEDSDDVKGGREQEGSSDDGNEGNSSSDENTSTPSSSPGSSTSKTVKEPPRKAPRTSNNSTANSGRRRRSTLKSSSKVDDKSVFRALAASCKRRGAQLDRLQKLLAPP